MQSINFDEGYKSYIVNDDPNRVIRIKLGDPGLLSRIRTAMKETDGLLGRYSEMPAEEAYAGFDKEFRGIVNRAFGTDICTPVFGDANVTAVTESGKFVFSAFFDAFIPQLEADIKAKLAAKKASAAEVRPEVRKYLEPPTVKPVAGLADPFGASLPDISGLTPEQKKLLVMQLLS